MVRIGRQIPHFKEVDPTSVSAVFSDDRRFRYLLKLRYADSLIDTGRRKSAAVILKNPSAADEKAADSTIRKVETYIYHHLGDVLELSILNIFALRATEPSDLNREYASRGAEDVIGPENDMMIRSVLEKADFVVAAWGNNNGINPGLYTERVKAVKHILAGTCSTRLFEVTKERETRQPLHGMMWAYGHRLQPYLKLKED